MKAAVSAWLVFLALASAAMGSEPAAAAPSPDSAAAVADSGLDLGEKKVRAATSRTHREKEVSRLRLDRAALKRVAAAQGDPFKALATLPGTSNQNDLSVRPFVRGGKSEETQVLWEGIPLIQPYHFGSVYSVFNIESLEDMTLYSGAFPARMGNALSGAVFMRSRPSPLDTFALSADLSVLRGNAYAGVPILKDRLGVSFAWQAFWYDWVFNRGLDLVDLFNDDKSFERNKRQMQNYLDLPNFRDFQAGLDWRLSDRAKFAYTAILSRDIFNVKESRQHWYVNGDEVSPDYHLWSLLYGDSTDQREHQPELDTLAAVGVNNVIHGVNLDWKLSRTWNLRATGAYQSQDWNVGFFDRVVWFDSIGPGDRFAGYRTVGPSDYRLEMANSALDWRLDAEGWLRDDMRLQLGASQTTRESEYSTRLPRPIFETIVNGNVDALDALGHFDPDGFVIRRDEPGVNPDADYLQRLPKLIRFNQEGSLSGSFLAGYASGEYLFDASHRMTGGVRAETDSYARRLFLSPRLAYFQALGSKDELSFASGLYSQSDFPFQIRGANRELEPEKAFHFNAEWTHAFSDRYKLEVQAYQKNYFDLVVPVLTNTGQLDWHSGPLEDGDSVAFAALPKRQQDSIIERFGDRRLDYRNGGQGKAGGIEVSFFYEPHARWGGWLSAEAGYSKRQDAPGERVYDFRYSRPWAFNWVNHLRLPERFAVAVRARYAAGLPYTDYATYGYAADGIGTGFSSRADTAGDTVFWAGPRNGARYAPYARWDLRVSRKHLAWGGRFESYFEIWNAFNTPNFLMTDAGTRQWKFVDVNYPIPILFLGLSARL